MASDAGLNTDEVKEALKVAKDAGNEEDARYLQRVLNSRGVPKANVNAYEIVTGNPEAYPEETVRQQEQEAIGRNAEPVKAEDLGVRGSEDASGDQAQESGSDSAPKRSASDKSAQKK